MIIIKIMGGLASQLHKYAIGRALSSKYNTELKLDLSWFENTPIQDTRRVYVLDHYSIKATQATSVEIRKFKPNWLLLKLKNKLYQYFGISIRFETYSNKSFMTLDEFNALPDNLYLEGEWAGYKYFEHIRHLLISELSPKTVLNAKVKAFMKIINERQTVSMHFRRGDYVTNPHASQMHCVCSMDYYSNAIKLLKDNIGEFRVFIFSDDIQWTKENFINTFDVEILYIEGLSDMEEFQIMSRCHHNIIANSSFSWLSAWLNQNELQQIIAPKNWVYDKSLNSYIVESISSKNTYFLDN